MLQYISSEAREREREQEGEESKRKEVETGKPDKQGKGRRLKETRPAMRECRVLTGNSIYR